VCRDGVEVAIIVQDADVAARGDCRGQAGVRGTPVFVGVMFVGVMHLVHT
jgi:hypothetical protein